MLMGKGCMIFTEIRGVQVNSKKMMPSIQMEDYFLEIDKVIEL